ncbi:ATP-dependent RNA helicase SUV3, putative [Pediculus humanus corporis]|uniref:ATP-dependent RNA helicase SUV3 homolog, mitochondrial n=1 Tax=Pediculus humanus subsp. corporis TaxID=121224 RepID=E0VFU1_PEDHC|nr:ATP-dependent RNA helicase SUV3, putative [Pediculus humanus corporis]EEB12247.1 ATP-dependent RNA helicase SUV3, putative [Pediculus humanus corporis]
MLFFNRGLIFVCAGRTVALKFLLSKSSVHVNKIRLISSTQIRYKKKTKSHLFTPISPNLDKYELPTGEELSGKLDKAKLVKVINAFYRNPELKSLAEENNLDSYLIQKGFISFRKFCLDSQNLPPDLHVLLSDIIQSGGNELDIFPYFLQHVKSIFPHLDCMEDLKKIGDLTSPSNWYPEARSMNRKIIFHCGPTNSGKTYNAMESYYQAKSGVYCGPLKLLAVEIFNKANDKGIQCDLVTGEEVIYSSAEGDQADHISCTVEMCSLENTYDVAVIDEIQMIKDNQRGWAWTRALLGLKAKEIHLCGEESAVDLVDSILCTTNENLEVKKYKRLTELKLDAAIESLKNVSPGDCIVCFSKRDIFNVTEALEKLGNNVAVIYGTLPPGTKYAECNKFNDPNNVFNILVSTDAIGMGLNLEIRRVVFYSLEKPVMNDNGIIEIVPISVSQALQIAGRAGRYGSRYEKGYVTTFHKKDLPLLEKILSETPEPAMSAGLFPTVDQIELYSFYLPQSTLSNLMDIFINLSTVDDSMYFICNTNDFKIFADMIEHIPLSLRVKYIFCSAPVNKKNQFSCSIFLKFAKMYSENSIISFQWLCKTINWPVSSPKNIKELIELEGVHDSLDLYLWLSYRFPDYFPDGDSVKKIQKELDLIIQKSIIEKAKLFVNWHQSLPEENHDVKQCK